MRVKMWRNGSPHIAGGNMVHLLWNNLIVSLKIKHIKKKNQTYNNQQMYFQAFIPEK